MKQQNSTKKTSTLKLAFLWAIALIVLGFSFRSFKKNQNEKSITEAAIPPKVKSSRSKSKEQSLDKNAVPQFDKIFAPTKLSESQSSNAPTEVQPIDKTPGRRLANEKAAAGSVIQNLDPNQAIPALKKELRLSDIQTQEDILNFLTANHLKNPEVIRAAKVLIPTPENIQMLAGRYLGELAWQKTPQAPLTIEVVYNPQVTDNRIQGQIKITLSAIGFAVQTYQLTPTVGVLTGDATQPAIVLQLSYRRILQMYYVKNLDTWIGNLYMINPLNGRLEYAGVATLKPVE